MTLRREPETIVQSVKDYEADTEERAFLKAVVQGLMDVEEGRTISLADAKLRLGLA